MIFIYITESFGENTSDSDPREGIKESEFRNIYTQITQNSIQDVPQQKTPVASFEPSEIGNNFMSVSYSSSPEDLVKIRKFTSPVNKSGYMLNDGLLISVEVSCKDDNVDKVEVSEIIDDELYVVEKSMYSQKLANISEIREYKKKLLQDPFGSLRCDVNNSECDDNTDIRKIFLGKILKHKFNGTNNKMTCNVKDEGSITCLLENLSYKYNMYGWNNLDCIQFSKSACNYNIYIYNGSNLTYLNLSLNATNNTGSLNFSDGRKYNLHVVENNSCLELYDLIKNYDFNISHINTDELFVYKYEIKPKKMGIFYIDTIAKTYARPYIEYPMIVDINAKPKFEIYPIPGKMKAVEGDKLDLVYVIKYTGGNPGLALSKVKIKLDENIDGYRIVPENKGPFDFTLYENKIYKAKIEFLKSGTYPMPGIWLNDEYQTFGTINIKVNTFWEDPLDLILKYWNIILALIGISLAISKIKILHDAFLLLISFIARKTLLQKYSDKLQSSYYKYKWKILNHLKD